MKYLVTGRIRPERASVSFSSITMKLSDSGTATISCDSSQITVALDSVGLDGWRAAYILGEQMAEVVVGALGFALGCGYSVDMIQITEESGKPHVFGVRPTMDDQGLGFEPDDRRVFKGALHLCGTDIYFRLAVQDFLRAIDDTTDCATYCFRAVESLKSSFAMRSGGDGWKAMHEALGTDRASITSTIKVFADPVRHGNWTEAPRTDLYQRWAMLWLTREILFKYFNYMEALGEATSDVGDQEGRLPGSASGT